MENKIEEKKEKVLGREDFLNLPKPVVKKAFIKTLEAYTFVKQMTAQEQDTYEESLYIMNTKSDNTVEMIRQMAGLKAKYLVRVLCDENGKRFFKDEEWEVLSNKFADVISELFNEVTKINRDTMEDLKEQEKK